MQQFINQLAAKLSVANITAFIVALGAAFGVFGKVPHADQLPYIGGIAGGVVVAGLAVWKAKPASALQAVHEFAQNIDDDVPAADKTALVTLAMNALVGKPASPTVATATLMQGEAIAPATIKQATA